MTILEIFNNNFNDFSEGKDEFKLIRYNQELLVGKDNNNNVSIVIKSYEPNRDNIAQRTKLLSFECNENIRYVENGVEETGVFHIIKCYSRDAREIELFLKLIDTYFVKTKVSIDEIVNTFLTLNEFFKNKMPLSGTAVQGLFTELFTIYHFRDNFNFSKYWQSKDKMNFDFSISEKIKLEIKSTRGKTRIHHFKHDQLNKKYGEIYILSYMLMEDDNGMSLSDLIEKCLPLLTDYPTKKARLLSIQNNPDNADIINRTRYSENYIIDKMRFISADEVPKVENDPFNVSKVEYDSDCESCKFIDCTEMISYFCKEIYN